MTNTQFESTDHRIAELNQTITALRVQITSLEETLLERDKTIQELRDDAALARERHRRDVNLIGDSLLSEAESRGWCEDFDNFVENLNDELYVTLPTRVRTYTMRVTATIEMEVEVEASSIEHAVDKAKDDVNEEINDMPSTYDWHIDDVVEHA